VNLGLAIAASGMLAEQVRQDQLANDLANSSTPGYKADQSEQTSFSSMLLANGVTGQAIGSISPGVTISRVVTNMAPGALSQTGQPLDFAIAGTGFFAVRTGQGVRYTRDGQFQANAQGLLTDAQGDLVLSQTGTPVTVGAKGAVTAGALGIFNVPNAAKVGNDNFSGTSAGRGAGTVQQGYLEASGSNPATTMVAMISSLQAFTAGQKAITTIDETMQQGSTQVGSLGGGA
jgi:flagellar basal-body rod protein FlgG